ncbi:MAG TPA: hypothetical protein VGB83_05295 [Actinomycetota bacterium]
MKRTIGSAAVVAVLALALGGAPPAQAQVPCAGNPHATPLPTTAWGYGGRIAFPAEAPSALVVMMHGYGHTSSSWLGHLKEAAMAGAMAFALDYTGTYVDDDGNVRGWFVQEGADDSIGLAQNVLGSCSTIDTVILLGVSMGGNASGLAAAAGATRGDGSPLFDYWIAAEPAANVIETYLEATAAEPTDPFIARAKADIEAEHGGTIADEPMSYAEGAVVLRTPDIAASGLQGIAVIHGLDDGLVPYDQAVELVAGLRANGAVTDFYTVARREPGGGNADNTSLTRHAIGRIDETYSSPVAGHATESSSSHIVMRTALDLMLALTGDGDGPSGANYVVDGEEGTIG